MKRINNIYISLIMLVSFIIVTLSFILNVNNEQEISLVVNTSNKNKIAYLTFDDGPSENTSKILNILDKYQIKATFFVIGPSYKLKNDLLKEIVNNSHTLAIHSYSHEYSKIYANSEAYLQDFYECVSWIETQTNIKPKIYRFPGGSSNTISTKSEITTIISSLYNDGYIHVDWNVDSSDSYYNKDSNAIIKSTMNYVKVNEKNHVYTQTILLHDNTKKIATIEALPSIIEQLISKGYTFKVLTENSNLIQHVKKPT